MVMNVASLKPYLVVADNDALYGFECFLTISIIMCGDYHSHLE